MSEVRGTGKSWRFLAISAAMLATFSRGALVGIGALLLWAVLTRRIPVWVIASGLVGALVVVALALTVWKPLIDVAFHEKTHIAPPVPGAPA